MRPVPSSFRLNLLTLVVLSIALGACSTNAQEDPAGWRLVWADEFNYNGMPDPARWRYDVGGGGWGNNELQFYTERRLENARVENGSLIIEARKEAFQGREYTSARLLSTGQNSAWQYGRIEVRAKLPSGRGTWPAVWMLPRENLYGGWPRSGEIDIMEHVGFNPDVVHGTVHTQAYNHMRRTERGGSITIPTSRSAFHVYSVEWNEDRMDFFVDGQKYFTFNNERKTNPSAGTDEWPFDQPFHLLLNIAVGGNWGGQQGVDPNIWPQRLEVDYVRVYQQAP